MNDTSPRGAAADPSGRLLELDAPGPRPVWAVLDAAGTRRFTGELTLACAPVVRAYFNDGEVYYAERDGDPTIGERLVEYGVLTPEELTAGTVQLGKVAHLGRLFDRVPTVERDPVELVLEVVTGELLGEIADHTVDSISVASYKHHPSGVAKWRRRAAGSDAPLTGEVPVVAAYTGEVPIIPTPAAHVPAGAHVATVHVPSNAAKVDHESIAADHEPTAADHQMVADYEQLMASTTDHVSVGEPTQQMVVPEGLRILESPAYPPRPPTPPRPVTDMVVAAEPVSATDTPIAAEPALASVVEVEVKPIAADETFQPVAEFDQVTWFEPGDAATTTAGEVEIEPAVAVTVAAVEEVASSAPFSFEFDLNKVLAQVALENDGLAFGPDHDDDDVDDDVRAAVRLALFEIEAATRPAITDGLSAVGFQMALETAPDSPADIQPAGQPVPRLPARALFNQPSGIASVGTATDTVSDSGDVQNDGELAATGTPGVGLRRLMGGTRKP